MTKEVSGSPERKRQRLSSPTYDDQVEGFTQEDLAAFDEIELRLSQPTNSSRPPVAHLNFDEHENFETPSVSRIKRNLDWHSSQPNESTSFPGFTSANAIDSNLRDDPENPFTIGSSKTTKERSMSAFTPPLLGFASASKLLEESRHFERSPSPEEPPPEPNYDGWFKPAPIGAPMGFQTAAFASTASAIPAFRKASTIANTVDAPSSQPPREDSDMDSWFKSAPANMPLPGFTSASGLPGFKKPSINTKGGGVILPSKEALAKAKALLESWDNEENMEINMPVNNENDHAIEKPHIFPGLKPASVDESLQSPQRKAFSSVINTPKPPVTPGSGFTRASLSAVQPKNTSSPSLQHRPGAFKPPSFNAPRPSPIVNSPLNPNRMAPSLGFTSAAAQHGHPLSLPPIVASRAVNGTPSSFTTPLRDKAPPRIRTTPAPFKTPFKPGMGPGRPARPAPVQTPKPSTPQQRHLVGNIAPAAKEPVNRTINERLSSNLPRKTFFNLRLYPQRYNIQDLEYFGVNHTTLAQITPDTAIYYTFHTTEATPPPNTPSTPKTLLDPAAALKELLDRGCTLATKPWVDNHWCLILWKLAGMVMLDPEKEAHPDTTRWRWAEVIRQLLYRYERELNGGTRPPLRKIANQDAPPAFPLVLCVSNIFWSPPGMTEDGLPIEPHPELEVTDGWYRLRAQVDAPMARAVRKGVLCVGRKIGVAGAKLETERKEPMEILDAYNSTKLVFAGNSSHLMPWHAKLGFMRGPCISTLHSLTPDGGIVTALDFVITQVHAIAFIEMFEGEDGKKYQEGPWKEAEESRLNEQWKKKYEMEAAKLRAVYEKKTVRYQGYIDRLERKAGGGFNPGEDDYAPDNIDSLYDELEYPDSAVAVIARISSREAGWLARYIRKQIEEGHERIAEEIEKELMTICPPRDVRSFRVLIVQDARTIRRPANRKAMLTVWNILGITLEEGSQAGDFQVGQRFLATNLVPTSASAWMDCEPGSEVYLCTTRNTRWTKIKGTGAVPS
ncbi:Breast cancer type 2 susceptibility protein-like protein [Psilocybe cubensis]|uniref:Breast cancer type 2 susceptibility protein-like protein n=1 Tax=Psilocybe cubensis TaxID=181762 RepID=A0ACB8HFL6_PSICU|nr:Breast cancer type 2 susceptibility protein-like protein [Psilocybe cubensis]KAH9486281.1 Breast cancer type 2 susceptibility protein-like protein [Psilocybe cubensis]